MTTIEELQARIEGHVRNRQSRQQQQQLLDAETEASIVALQARVKAIRDREEAHDNLQREYAAIKASHAALQNEYQHLREEREKEKAFALKPELAEFAHPAVAGDSM